MNEFLLDPMITTQNTSGLRFDDVVAAARAQAAAYRKMNTVNILADGGPTRPDYAAMAKVVTNRNKDKNFVQRALNPDKYPHLTDDKGNDVTHLMTWSDNGESMDIYPTVVYDNGKLKQLDDDEAFEYAIRNNERINIPISDFGDWYSQNGLIEHKEFAKGGGLSRSKDYGSKKKPYPSVKSGDFAGGGRSYPIPTKADAVDALRLAGLHHRADVKAKVYKKYPSLKHPDGGPLNQKPPKYKSPYELALTTYEQPVYSTQDNTRTNIAQKTIEAEKAKLAQKQREEAAKQYVTEVRAAQSPQSYKSYNTNPTLEGLNNEAANWGYAMGTGHDMTANEVNNWNLNTASLAGYIAAPQLMTALTSGYYYSTGRPEEGALTTALGFGLPVVKNTGKGVKSSINNYINNYKVNNDILNKEGQKIIEEVRNQFKNDFAINPTHFYEKTIPKPGELSKDMLKELEISKILDAPVKIGSDFGYFLSKPKRWFSSNAYARKTNNGNYIIRINPFYKMSEGNPNEFRGVITHEGVHPFQEAYSGNRRLVVPDGLYYHPNPNFQDYSLLKPFDKIRGWFASPEELQAEMFRWKKVRDIPLDLQYKDMPLHGKVNFLDEVDFRFNPVFGSEKLGEIHRVLNGLSELGYFAYGGILK